ncbi:O-SUCCINYLBENZOATE SYNTHASE [Salix viminalis]|uniref:Dipeptide epimerase n=1 Tax=Salix viminalis TaxID=40686 RepID=A0A9Q0NMT8_SALVM|nr:O-SUCCINYLBENZOATE SYNTHASE [Salix viminalis]
MLSIGSLCFSLKTPPKPLKPSKTPKLICKLHATKAMAGSDPKNISFFDLMETFVVDVKRAENRPLNVPLIAPFTIASSRLDKVGNVAIRIELSDGCVGWGEAPILPFVTAEDQSTAMIKASEACQLLKNSSSMKLGLALERVSEILPGHEFASVRAGVEMALIDAVAKSISVPLWILFGGASDCITTDITIPIVSPAEAAELASKYRKQGFQTLKLKVGKNLREDIEVLQAIRAVHPDCLFILDANEGYKPEEAIEVLEKLHKMGVTPVLFEQPVHRDDWEGLGHVTHIARVKYGVSVAADESCRSLVDAKRIITGNLADVINIKLAKVGVVGGLEIIELARTSGLDLMIGGMVETRLAMGFAGHLAAGLGCFKFIDLDTPLLMSEDPVLEGYEVSGAIYKFTDAQGHAGFLDWDNVLCKSHYHPDNVKEDDGQLSLSPILQLSLILLCYI